MEEVMQVSIMGIQGKKRLLTLPKVCLVDQLYDEVINAKCAPISSADELRLVYGGKELVRGERKFLHDFQIPNMANIVMVVRMRGGLLLLSIFDAINSTAQ